MKLDGEILIGGAGIGGLALAARLARRGMSVTLLDRAPKPAPVGSGFVLQPVGLAALVDLGLDQAVVELGARINQLNGETKSGRVVLSARYDARKGKLFGLALQRAALFELLYETAQVSGVMIRHGAEVIEGDAQSLTLAGGERISADLVIDSLGATSTLSPSPGVDLPYGALWATLNWRAEDGFAPDLLEQRYERASKMTGVLPLGVRQSDRTPKVAYFWSLRRDQVQSWTEAPLSEWKGEAEALWPETAPLLAQINDHSDLVMATYRHRTLRRPITDGLVHIGDSYHAASPQLGQGANMALLDAAAFDLALADAHILQEALESYADRRRWHVRLYQLASRLFTPVYQSDSRVLPLIRDIAMAPVSKIWPGNAILSSMIAGSLGAPLAQIGLETRS
ncbi:MAG: NAD(P)/FAD-dependent oxidoreductase [Pseudomonadota bacterium]